MVDSGNQVSDGTTWSYNYYKEMVENALIRPPQIDIRAFWWRTGDHVEFIIRLDNLSDDVILPVWIDDNYADLHAIVYEDTHINVTNRLSRATVFKNVWNLAPGFSYYLTLETTDLPEDVNWEKLHSVVLVDYQVGNEGFDMLQAVIAEPLTEPLPEPFEAKPDTLTFFIDPSDSSNPESLITLVSPFSDEWFAFSNNSWITVTPTNSTIETQATISINRNQLTDGWQQGIVTFSNTEGDLSDEVLVNAFLGKFDRVYLPIVEK